MNEKENKIKETKKVNQIFDTKKNNYILDNANIMIICKTPEYVDVDGFECDLGKMSLVKFEDMSFTVDKYSLILPSTRLSYAYVDRFIKTIKAWFDNKNIVLRSICFYASDEKDMPVLLVYGNFMAILAPRVERE